MSIIHGPDPVSISSTKHMKPLGLNLIVIYQESNNTLTSPYKKDTWIVQFFRKYPLNHSGTVMAWSQQWATSVSNLGWRQVRLYITSLYSVHTKHITQATVTVIWTRNSNIDCTHGMTGWDGMLELWLSLGHCKVYCHRYFVISKHDILRTPY